jgi:hypothetical protein
VAPPDEPTHILVYRDPEERVKFMQLNNISRLLLELIQAEGKATGLELLTQVADTIGHPDPERVIAGGANLLMELKEKGVILGTRR